MDTHAPAHLANFGRPPGRSGELALGCGQPATVAGSANRAKHIMRPGPTAAFARHWQGPMPVLEADTDDVLQDMGLSSAEVAQLREEHVI